MACAVMRDRQPPPQRRWLASCMAAPSASRALGVHWLSTSRPAWRPVSWLATTVSAYEVLHASGPSAARPDA
jgi:hypothetical protein